MPKTFVKTSKALDGTWHVPTAAGSRNVFMAGRGVIDGDGYTLRNTAAIPGGNLIDTLLFINNDLET